MTEEELSGAALFVLVERRRKRFGISPATKAVSETRHKLFMEGFEKRFSDAEMALILLEVDRIENWLGHD